VCDRVLVEQTTVNKTNHDFTGAWVSNGSGHWHVCKNAGCNETDTVAGHTPNSFGKCTVCDYQGEIPFSSVTAEQWTAAFAALEDMRNFTLRLNSGSVVMFIEVMENVIHSYDNYDGEVQEMYEIYDDDTVTMWYNYGHMWLSRTESTDGEDFDYAVSRILHRYLSGVAQSLGALYENFEYDQASKSYVWEFTEDAVYRYEVKFVGTDIYAMESIYGVGSDAPSVSTVDAIGNTNFEIEPLHQHEYATEWSSNNVYHWHDAVCHDGEVDAKVPHSWGSDNKCTVCGYEKATSVNSQVDEDAFESALQFNGLTNWTVTLYEDGELVLLIKRAGNVIYISNYGERAYYEIADDGSIWLYIEVEEGVWEKTQAVEEEAMMFEVFIKYGFAPFSQLALLWDELNFADGVYTVNGLPVSIDSFLFSIDYANATISFKFNDGEILTISIEEMDGEEILGKFVFGEIGTTAVTLPDATLHEHDWQIVAYENYHKMTCSVCGNYKYEEHKFGTNGACTVCGAQNHKHVYTQYIPSADVSYHNGVCACGVISNSEERHVFGSDDICDLCGAERHIHDVVEWYERNENYHEGYCSECGSFGGAHEWGADGKTCIVCEYVRHIHTLDPSDGETYFDKNVHTGQCTDPNCPTGGYVNWEEHVWGENNGNCIVCGAPYHGHDYVWLEGNSADEHTHELSCSDPDCYSNFWADHNWDGDTCTVCGYRVHDHEWDVTYADADKHELRCSICGVSRGGGHAWEGDTCSICGYKDHQHTWVYDYADVEYHEAHCSECSAMTEGEHEWEDDACFICGVLNHDHNFSIYENIPYDIGRHYVKCACGAVENSYDCRYESDESTECAQCGAPRHDHTWVYDRSKGSFSSPTHHYYVCSNPNCQATLTEEHAFDDDSDENCNVCGAFRHYHSVQSWDCDDNYYHRGYYSGCGTVYEEHEVSEWHDNENGYHVGECDVCGEQITREHNLDGSDCIDCEYSQSND
ncbi:MAG: hypothetical protein J1F66_03690, partial [Clostridiales bacterium]|nr:hypothetical protein [Clostridiales bacterium]